MLSPPDRAIVVLKETNQRTKQLISCIEAFESMAIARETTSLRHKALFTSYELYQTWVITSCTSICQVFVRAKFSMSGPTERIYRDLSQLNEEIAELARGFDRTYTDYLTALGQAIGQQAILATYHLCTHSYPEAFLQLSFERRQKFQETLREIAKGVDPLLQRVRLSAMLRVLQEAAAEEFEEDEDLDEDEFSDGDNEDEDLDEEEEEEDDDEDLFAEEIQSLELSLMDLESFDSVPTLSQHQPMTPQFLLRWQQALEAGIVQILATISNQINQLLRTYKVLPPNLPPPLLEAASQAEATSESVSGPPNVLSLLIETETSNESAPSNVMQLTTVHLRLSEIEFADTQVKSVRDRLRQLSGQLIKLGKAYQKKQRERAVIEAESAWRSSWFDD
ncbi:Chromosome segregation ATPase [Geitlerinema sp. FC II]|nr:Chromosome segregation ATPase [Geitlerinema sp. FC II]